MDDSEPSVRVIVFSKDRAFQLGQYLRTLFASSRGATLDVHVLFRTDPPANGRARDFAASYARVQAAFPAVNFVREDNFAVQVVLPVPSCRSSCCLSSVA